MISVKEQEIKKRHAVGEAPKTWDSDMKEMKQWADETRKKESAESSLNRKPLPKQSEAVSRTKASVQKSEVKQAASKSAISKQTAQNKPAAKKPSAPKKTKASVKQSLKRKNNADKKPNYLLWVTIIIIAIPCLILLYILIGSRENSSTPVEGSRFKDALDPKITEEDLKALETSLTLEGAEAIEINLKSATLRININTQDDLSQKKIQQLIKDAYVKVDEKLPIDKYFTNKKNGEKVVKMYDLEINAYNYIPENEDDKKGQIHISRVKNSAAEKPVDDVLSKAKDKQSAEEILNPDTSNPPTNDNTGKTEGE